MQKIELRVGSWVMKGEHFYQIKSGSEIDYDLKVYQPIPLSNEVIEQAGFVHYQDNIFMHEQHTWLAIVFTGRLMLMHFNGEPVPMSISSLHQLQNLFFAHAGVELELKKPSKGGETTWV